MPSSAVHKKNKLMLTQSRGGNIGRYPCNQMPDVIDIALIEIRREHSIVGDYNAVVGDLVMKQKERKELAVISTLKDRDHNQNDEYLHESQSYSFSSVMSEDEG